MSPSELRARVEALEQRIAALEASRAQSVASLASVNAARRAKRKEMLDAVKIILQWHPQHTAKEVMKTFTDIGFDPTYLPSTRSVQRLVRAARQTLGVSSDAGDFETSSLYDQSTN